MEDPGYPLAQADRAFAYDGAFRTPDAMSAASRAAYGMHDRADREAPAFCEALRKAVHGPERDKPPARRCSNAGHPNLRTRSANGAVASPIAQRDADLFAHAARAIRPPASSRRPGSVYYLFASCAGSVIRAIVRQGRVFSGGVRTCPISKP